jgi:putative transposase
MTIPPQRRSIRLPNYDYTQDGAYFVTICTYQKACLFGEVTNDEMMLNTLGCIVDEEWLRTASLRPYVELDTYIVMPNHFHAIAVINHGYEPRRTQHAASLHSPQGVTRQNVKSQSLSAIIRAFKAATTIRINSVRLASGVPVWQGRFYEHIIRTEQSLNHIRQYIIGNPQQWTNDRENPDYRT